MSPNPRRLIARLIPEPLRRRWRQRRERKAWDAFVQTHPVPDIPASALAEIEPDALKQQLATAALEEEWAGMQSRLLAQEIPKLTGGVNPGDQRALYALARSRHARAILEIGTLVGASTAHLALAQSREPEQGEPPRRLVTVDIQDVNDSATRPWERFDARRSPASMLRDLGVDGWVEFVARDSAEYLRQTTTRFDLVFLDGSHAKEQVYREIPLAIGVLRPGGLIVLHDYCPNGEPIWPEERVIPGPFLACEALRGQGIPLRVTPLSPLPWPTKRGGNKTSLALVHRA